MSIGGRPLNMLSVQIGILQTIWKFFIRVFNLKIDCIRKLKKLNTLQNNDLNPLKKLE